MIVHSLNEDGDPKYTEGEYWIEVGMKGSRNNGTNLYHHCLKGGTFDVLLDYEVFDRYCNHCGAVEIPDQLWTMYVLMGGRGVFDDGFDYERDT